MAGALGMTVTQFNNNLYEKNGCRFFEVSSWKRWKTFPTRHYWQIRPPSWCFAGGCSAPEELDRVDLFSRAMRTSAAGGQVDQIIEQALEDGVIESHGPKKSANIIAAIWQLGKKRLPQLSRYFHAKEVTPASCSSRRRGVSLSVEITNA